MATINSVTLKGNITFDAEVKKVGQGISLCKLPLAVNIYTKKAGQDKPESEPCYIDVVCWGETADRVGTLKRGDEIIVHGRLKMESWQDKQTGATRTKHVIMPTCVEATKFLGEKKQYAGQQNQAPQPVAPQQQKKPTNQYNQNQNMPFGNNNNGYGSY